MYRLEKKSRSAKMCEVENDMKHSVSCLCGQWNRKALRVFESVCKGLLHWLGAFGQGVRVVKTEDPPSFG